MAAKWGDLTMLGWEIKRMFISFVDVAKECHLQASLRRWVLHQLDIGFCIFTFIPFLT